LAEAARLGFTEAVVPAETRGARDRMTSVRHGLRVHAVPTLSHALRVLSIVPRAVATDPVGEAGAVAG
jgi:DNA repair protein RadA/Sms